MEARPIFRKRCVATVLKGWSLSAEIACTRLANARVHGARCESTRGQEFVIGGYTVGGNPFDTLVFGYYEGDDLIFVARTRNGFTPMLRRQLFAKMQKLETPVCPFSNLPEKKSGRWGQGLTAEKMAECRWLKPVLVGQFEFVEWTQDNHLRHSRFIGLRADKHPMR